MNGNSSGGDRGGGGGGSGGGGGGGGGRRSGDNESENEKSLADDIVDTDNITLDNLLPDRSSLLLSRIAPHVRICHDIH